MKSKSLTYEQLFRMYRKMFKENNEVSVFYSNCIKLMHQIVQDITKIKTKEYMKTKKYTTGSRAMSELYEIKITHNFVAHFNLLKNGIVFASYNHLRSIYEIIIKIYLNITEPNLGELNFKYETIENNKKLSKEQIQKIKQEFKSKGYLKPSFIQQKLYSDDILKSTRDFYHKMCDFVHPSILSMSACFEFNSKTFIDSYKVGIGLLICNFIILFELYGNLIKKRYKKRLSCLVKDCPKYIPEGVPALIPSKNKNRLLIKDYNEFINLLENVT